MHINRKLAAGTRRIVIAALLLGICSFGNAQNVENQIIASQFGQFKLYGVNDGFNFPPASCQLSAGNKNFVAFQQGVPVRVVDTGTPSLSETVIAGPVSIQTCAVSLPVTNFHASFYVTSGTAGLQEAINANGPGAFSNTVILDNAWYALGGNSSIIANAQGYSNLGLVDITTTPYTWYAWNGSHYVESAIGQDVTSVFGRTGAVVAQTGDYTCLQVTNCGPPPNSYLFTTLSAGISSSATTIPLTSVAGLIAPGEIIVGSEWIYYTGISGDTLTGATRGYHTTTASAATSGTNVFSVIADFTNPSQAPSSYITTNGADVPFSVFNCNSPDFSQPLAAQFNCDAYGFWITSGGGIEQLSASQSNIFESEVTIGSSGGGAPITNSGYLFDSTRQNESSVLQGFGAGIAGPVQSVVPQTIAAPSLTCFIPSGTTTWSYEVTGTDIDGNTIPGTVASCTGSASFSGEIIVKAPFAAGVANFVVWQTAGPTGTGSIAEFSTQGGSTQYFGATPTPGTPPATNSSVPKVCTNGEQYCQLSGTTSTPTVACASGTQGWTFHNVSATVSPFAYVCNGTAWVTAY